MSIALLSYSCRAQAELKIPNPLLQPQKVKATPEASPMAPPSLPPTSSLSPMMPVPLDSPNGSAGLGGKPGRNDTLREIRDHLSAFHVSAVLGKQAILRKTVANQGLNVQGASVSPSNTTLTSVAPAAAGSGTRNETMLVSDGEPVDFVGDNITLLPRVTGNRVFLYHTEGGKKMPSDGKTTVVFFGEVESPGALPKTAPVLERPDTAYRQSINVETKARTTSNNSNGLNGSNSSPAQAPQMLQ